MDWCDGWYSESQTKSDHDVTLHSKDYMQGLDNFHIGLLDTRVQQWFVVTSQVILFDW